MKSAEGFLDAVEVGLHLHSMEFYNEKVRVGYTHNHISSSIISWLYVMEVQTDLKSCKDPLATMTMAKSV